MKYCKMCNVYKNTDEFYRCLKHKDGLSYRCKECTKSYFKNYYIANRNKIILRSANWAKNNLEKRRNQIRNGYMRNKTKINAYKNKHCKQRMKTDILFKLKTRLRIRLYQALNFKKWGKNTKFSLYIGCSAVELKRYLESKFTEGMSWDNYGLKGWHIDHIVPLSSATTEQELYKLCHFTNLQPLWWQDNFKKSNNLNYIAQEK